MSTEKITEFTAGERLDKELARLHPEYSRASIEKLIERGEITVNGTIVKTKYILKSTDVVEVRFQELKKEPESIDLPILYEDENVVVINKPTGVLTHSKGEFNKEGTVATFLKSHVLGRDDAIPDQAEDDNTQNFWNSNRAGIVHRLDRATSGVIICAKDKQTENYLKGQFSKRNVKKTYLAIIEGDMPSPEGIIDMAVERNPKKPATFRTGANGKPAQTHFKTLRTDGKRSLVELKPVTGRTHQLRVHLAHFKRPIIGDSLYDGVAAERLMLHAKDIELTLPGGNRQLFSAPVPPQFLDVA